ncbi:lamin tail domain-containing protein [Halococcus saccharolyticus]|uniref:Micrococcal nuclease-like nuclease n=1 Tax=Halococcus saccharolyticus DSM 5350 TaxID=1227455 RepID=M0MAK8_9EURY|nr:lamin tail domain-containing protein [Halococcus saccharolyticus]EMA42786.1 micrococcal nuclease-like nuclease [Halococcus saccharolyticus DSM 5350]
MRRLTWVLVTCVVLTGCAGTTPGTTEPTASPVETPGATTTPAATATGGTAVDRATGRAATVIRVVDGDTIEVRYSNGTIDTVRLLGVDTPEVHVANDPPEFEGVPDTEAGNTCLRDAGRNASEFVERVLADEQVRLVVGGDRRDRYGRLLAFVRHDGTGVNYRLVAEGYARVYDTSFAGRDRFDRAETRAQRKKLGLWTCATDSTESGATTGERSEPGGLVIAEIDADAPGNDNANPNGERIVFENRGEDRLVLAGWTVSDAADHTYTFPQGFALGPGERVALYTGSGSDSRNELYWGASGAVWNNDGDTVTVRNEVGKTVAERSYG